MLVITKECIYLHITNSQTQINAMEKQIKIGKITLDVVMPYVKVVRYWKTDCYNKHLKDQSLEELKVICANMADETKTSIFWKQTRSYQDTHGNTYRIIKALIDVMETGSQIKPIKIG